MSFSIQRETSDGTLSTIDLAIEYIDQADISVFVDDTLIEMTGGVTPYTWEWVTPSKIKITPTVATGLVAMIRRGTPNDAMYHNFNAGAVFKDETMDENFLQLLYLVQEAKEGSGATDFYANLDMHGYIIRNHGPALLDSDVVTLGQYRNDALGAMANRVLAESARDTAVAAKDLAVTSASNAATSENNAAASELAAAGSASAAEADRILAGTSAASAVAAFDSFDDRYLGSKASDPGADNDGDPLLYGALYWNTTVNELRVFNGVWLSVALLPNTYLQIANNLSDLDDVVVAKQNLGLDQVTNTSDADKPISTTQAAGLVSKDSNTGAAQLPAGTTAQRPSNGVGKLRYNSELSRVEVNSGASWDQLGGIVGPASAIGNALVRFDSTTGNLVKGSSAILNDSAELSVSAIQVGQSGTLNNNFHWWNLLDGLLRLSRGNAGSPITDVMRVKADNSVEFPGNVASGVLGAGQTEQTFTIGITRINGTTYTNTTGRPIEVTIGFAANSSISFTVNGTIKISGSTAASVFFCTSFIVPSGATYSATGAFVWTELR